MANGWYTRELAPVHQRDRLSIFCVFEGEVKESFDHMPCLKFFHAADRKAVGEPEWCAEWPDMRRDHR